MKTPEQIEAEEAYKKLMELLATQTQPPQVNVIKQKIQTLEEQIEYLKSQLAHFGE